MIPESNEKSTKYNLFVKIIAHCSNQNKEDIVDDWGQVIRGGQDYLEVRHLCKSIDHSKGALYIVDNRQMFIFKESIVYPFVQAEGHQGKNEKYYIENQELSFIVDYVQNMGMCHL